LKNMRPRAARSLLNEDINIVEVSKGEPGEVAYEEKIKSLTHAMRMKKFVTSYLVPCFGEI